MFANRVKPQTDHRISPDHYENLAQQISDLRGIQMKSRHEVLGTRYRENPDAAVIRDRARTNSGTVPADHPVHTELTFGHGQPVSLPVGIHQAVGGECDFPNPGDILCGAIAACLDSTLRIMANRVGVKLKSLSVEVSGRVDVRGTLRVARDVPVGFQAFDIVVDIVPRGFVPGKLIDKLLRAAEASCVVLQSLRQSPEIGVRRK